MHHFHLSCHMHDFGRACFCVTSFQKAKRRKGLLVLCLGVAHSSRPLRHMWDSFGSLVDVCKSPRDDALACCMFHVGLEPRTTIICQVFFAYDHTTMNTPVLVRSRKLSIVGPG